MQRLVGKCVSFSLAVPAALLFTREMNAAIGNALRSSTLITVEGRLREEVAHWLFLQTWDDPLPWRDEKHVSLTIATDASGSGWGASLMSPQYAEEVSDYWVVDEQSLDISVKEAPHLHSHLGKSGRPTLQTIVFSG